MLVEDIIPHLAIINIMTGGSGTDSINCIKQYLTKYGNITKTYPYTSSIATNVPSGLIGKFTNISQDIILKTTRDKINILASLKNLEHLYKAKISLIKWDNEFV